MGGDEAMRVDGTILLKRRPQRVTVSLRYIRMWYEDTRSLGPERGLAPDHAGPEI